MNKAAFSQTSKSVEWFTPDRYAGVVRELLDGIALDPASCQKANKNIRAKKIFTKRERGLTKVWKARTVFCNPPYGRDRKNGAGAWTAKMISEYKAGHFEEGVLLVLANTGQKWFQPLWNFPVCFTDHRIQYIDGSCGERTGGTTGSCFIYFGKRPAKFIKLFSQFGVIVRQYERAH